MMIKKEEVEDKIRVPLSLSSIRDTLESKNGFVKAEGKKSTSCYSLLSTDYYLQI